MQMNSQPSTSNIIPSMNHQPTVDCDSPYRYATPIYMPGVQAVPPTAPPPSHQQPHILQPTPTPPIHHSSSAFCALPPQAHHDPNGKSFFLINFDQIFFALISFRVQRRPEEKDYFSPITKTLMRRLFFRLTNFSHKSQFYLTFSTLKNFTVRF